MKKLITLLTAILLVLAFMVPASAGKITGSAQVDHKGHLIVINCNAVAAHLAHGDDLLLNTCRR